MNPRPSGYEPECGATAELGKRAKRLVRQRFWFASFRVLDRPIALSCAMDVRWSGPWTSLPVPPIDPYVHFLQSDEAIPDHAVEFGEDVLG